MNPIKNKKDLETSIEEIRNFAYSYLEKYSPSKQQLRTYLFKKLIKKKQRIFMKREIFNLIDSVISSLVDQKFLSDKYYSDAKHYDYLSYKEVLDKDLKVMDASAIALARENNIPIIVFSIHTQGAFMEVINGKGKFTVIGNSQED